ncbi:MAG: glutathione S-transferase family protein [Porticoccaceae bacterium]
MAQFKLTYFDFDGGRAEPARLALKLGGLRFEDVRIPIPDWDQYRDQFRYRQLPEFEVNGKWLNQSNAIARYIGRLTGYYPEDPWEAALCDAIVDTADDTMKRLIDTFTMAENEKKAVREELVATTLPMFLSGLHQSLLEQGGTFFADNHLSIADLKVYVMVNDLTNGHLDDIPTTLVATHAPELLVHQARVRSYLRENTPQLDYV